MNASGVRFMRYFTLSQRQQVEVAACSARSYSLDRSVAADTDKIKDHPFQYDTINANQQCDTFPLCFGLSRLFGHGELKQFLPMDPVFIRLDI
jgi:hypothetical protein